MRLSTTSMPQELIAHRYNHPLFRDSHQHNSPKKVKQGHASFDVRDGSRSPDNRNLAEENGIARGRPMARDNETPIEGEDVVNNGFPNPIEFSLMLEITGIDPIMSSRNLTLAKNEL
ncbi:hypothetical protein M8C21_009522 [Ambrosia artemisiifolia]|uniref:Uncharacterized protein n=1 Tax=Ambrosia artemisiifolia TaxID=4212 RepID=A0AAD5BYN7_AMBAR|nr:hypothetical protein M8C21_009522 [Ambrosia artemisiifolia]